MSGRLPTTCTDWPKRTIVVFDRRLTIHAGVINSLRRIEAKWRAAGGHDFYAIPRGNIGGFMCRAVTGGSILSVHGLGLAIDINPAQNPYTTRRPAPTNMPPKFVKMWKDEGWGWGGDWTGSHRDAMHFSKHPREYGDGKLEEPNE